MPRVPRWYRSPHRWPALPAPEGAGDAWKFTAVVPAKNEAGTLLPLLHYLQRLADEVLLIDGHSTDGTQEVAAALGVRVIPDNGRGKGAALRRGLLEARNEFIVFLDADGSHDPREIPGLLEPLARDQADHVSGSRMLGGSEELHATLKQSIRLFGSQVVTLLINYTQGVRLTDCQNGFRAIRRSVALDLGLAEDIHSIEQEMIIKTVRCGYRLLEVPTHEFARANGDSTFRIREVWRRFLLSLLFYLFVWSPEGRSPTTV